MDLNPETVFFVVDKAQQFQVKEQAASPGDDLSPSDDRPQHILAEDADDLVYQELKTTIDDLEPDQQVSLVALMWLGRGDFSAEEWDSAFERAGESWNDRSAEYLIGTPLLADYLTMGLEQLGHTRG
ncbi:MAG: DUF3775 domain-containing protein [Gammaproteobacteria bacterium]